MSCTSSVPMKKSIAAFLLHRIGTAEFNSPRFLFQEKIREFFAIPKEVIPHIHWNRYSIPTDESIEDLENQVEKLEKQLVKV